MEFGLRTMPGDEAFYFKNRNGKLNGAVLSHVDDFTVTGERVCKPNCRRG